MLTFILFSRLGEACPAGCTDILDADATDGGRADSANNFG